jgi:3-hydroxybutyryl-CoA dehydrogenase
MNLGTVGVVGAGVIGSSLTHALVTAGLNVIVHDVSGDALDRIEPTIKTIDRMLRLRGMTPGTGPRGRLSTTTALADVAGVDLLVENITEDIDLKLELHRQLDKLLPPDTVVAVNTSAVPISRLALATGHPGRVVGTHFMNPVALSEAVEVVRTPCVSPAAMDAVLALLTHLGKSAVVVADSAGFVINRCLMMMINEAADLLDDVESSPADVDRLFRSCLGHRSGPLQTADLIGIDTVVRTLAVLSDYYGPARFTASPRLRRMVDMGQLGRKSGRGFYDYAAGGRPAAAVRREEV